MLFITLSFLTSYAGTKETDTTGIDKSVLKAVELIYSQPAKANKILDSVENILKNYPNDKLLARVYYTRGGVLSSKQKLTEALKEYNKSIVISKKIKDNERLIHIYHAIGALYINKGVLDSAKKYFTKSYRMSLQNTDSLMTAIIQVDLANILTYEGNYDSSLKLLYAAEPWFIKSQNHMRLLLLYSSLGMLNQKIKDFKLSFYYLFKAMELDTIVERINIIPGLLNSIGETHFARKNFDSALYYYKLSMNSSSPELNSNTYFGALNNIGNVFLHQQKYNEALDYYLRAYEAVLSSGDRLSTTALSINLGYVYLQLKDYEKAKKFLYEGAQMAHDNSLLEYEINAIRNIYLLDSTQQNYLQAIVDLKKYYKLSDSLVSGKTLEKIEILKSNFELKKNREENKKLQREKSLQDILISRQKYLIYSLGSVVLVFIILIFVIFYNRRKIRRLHHDLQKKNSLIEKNNRDLNKSNLELSSLNKMKDKFFSILAHDLRSPFNSILGILELLIDPENDFSEDEKMNMLSIVSSTAKKEYDLLENLLNWSMIQRGKIVNMPEKIDLSKIIDKSIELYSLNAKQKGIEVNSNVETGLTLWADPQLVSIVINNLLNNALKFTSKNGKINIEANRNDSFVEICVSDTGVGIPSGKLDKLFDEDNEYRVEGTDYEQGSGLGLVLCREYVELMKGKIFVTSTEGLGSRFCFTIPLSGKE